MCLIFTHLAARFKETKSTCGAATCTVTSVNCAADGDWSKDQRSETQRILSRKAAGARSSLKCRVCDKGSTETTFSSSLELAGDRITCDSCKPVNMHFVKGMRVNSLIVFDASLSFAWCIHSCPFATSHKMWQNICRHSKN